MLKNNEDPAEHVSQFPNLNSVVADNDSDAGFQNYLMKFSKPA